MTLRILIASAFLVTLSNHVLAWGYQGHEVVGPSPINYLGRMPSSRWSRSSDLSFGRLGLWILRAQRARFRRDFQMCLVKPEYRIPCTAFERAAETARMEDDVSLEIGATASMKEHHGCDEAYHFADVAIQHDEYSRSYAGTNDHDVVSAINAAIMVLRDQNASLPFSIRDKKRKRFFCRAFCWRPPSAPPRRGGLSRSQRAASEPGSGGTSTQLRRPRAAI